ncbi:MAG: heme exporter protein CcmD [Gammaproteobacteria bacterium]|nr:heme exporter protein CcmD [Gammaproteobacteria bacterium]
MNLPEFLDMGHYAPYVWGSYGVVAAFMLVEVILLVGKRRSLVKSIARMTRLNRSDR